MRRTPLVIPSALVLMALVIPAVLLAVVAVDEGFLSPALAYTINDGAGDQFDPHVDGDIASYTSVDDVRFYNFFTGADLVLYRR